MAISPKDVSLTEEEIATVHQLEKEVDKRLIQDFIEGEEVLIEVGRISERLSIWHKMSPRIAGELARRYRSTGWEVSFKNRADYTLGFKPTTSPQRR